MNPCFLNIYTQKNGELVIGVCVCVSCRPSYRLALRGSQEGLETMTTH